VFYKNKDHCGASGGFCLLRRGFLMGRINGRMFLLTACVALFFAAAAVRAFAAQEVEYTLQPTDVIRITVHEQPDLNTRARITQNGNITFPLIGKVQVKGKTVSELEQQIRGLLAKDYLVNPQVLVFIEEYHARQVSVIGEVNDPGKYDMPPEKEMTLLEAIALAGGFSDDAEINKTRIMRVSGGERETITVRVKDITEKGQKEKDVKLKAGDVIVVPESFF
jgi:polysaccharide export outer membrane protein